jgi:hypothetical protein
LRLLAASCWQKCNAVSFWNVLSLRWVCL